jgi:hydrogenase/urease accessory protein HupE
MSQFEFFARLGFSHITDFDGFDHMLFLLALCAVYQFVDWRRWFWAITFFAIGHSATLLISGMGWISVNADWIEFLIPVTILVTAIGNLLKPGKKEVGWRKPILAGIFGLIHGFGFSNFFKMAIEDADSPFLSVLYFTAGIELGQLAIVAIIFLTGWSLTTGLKVKQRDWVLVVSGAVLGLSLLMLTEAWPL